MTNKFAEGYQAALDDVAGKFEAEGLLAGITWIIENADNRDSRDNARRIRDKVTHFDGH